MPDSLLRIRAALENERGPLYIEPALSALHSLNEADAEVSLEIGMAEGKIGLFVRATEDAAHLVESQLYAQYPDIDIETINDSFLAKEGEEVVSMDLHLVDTEVFPIKRHPQFDDMLSRVNVDPLAGISSSLAKYSVPGMRGHVQIVMKPAPDSFRKRALRFLPLLNKGIASLSVRYASFFARVQLARGWKRLLYLPFSILMGGFRSWPIFSKFMVSDLQKSKGKEYDGGQTSTRSHDREDAVIAAYDKVNRLLFLCNVRLSVITPKEKRREALLKLKEIASSFTQFSLPHCNSFDGGETTVSQQIPHGFVDAGYALSVEEIATLWHLPTLMVQTPNLDWVLSKKLEPPINLPLPGTIRLEGESELTVLGASVFRGQRTVFGIRQDDRRRHIYSIGKTGMGKSTLLENMIFSDIHSGKGLGVIDPHGDLIEAILQFIPKHRSNDVILFDPSDTEYPISFNVLECSNPLQRDRVASGLMSVFTKMWPDAFSGRMEHILRNCILALLEYEGSSMLGIMRLFSDDGYREKVVSNVTNPLVKSFWNDEYAVWSEKYRTEAIAAIQNKVGQLLTTPLLRNIVGQVSSSIDLRHAMDTGKIVLVNLSKGKLGEDISAFLGSMLVTKFQIDAMSRADIPEKERRDFYLYVDEFQNFATESFASILSEARKFRLSLTMAHQYVNQLLINDNNTSLRDAVFGNVGSIISFQVGSDDAESLSLQFEEMVTPKDILSLPKYHAYSRLMIDGIPSKPFSISTLPPPDFQQDEGRVEILRNLTRERYAEKRSVIEEKIGRWAASQAEARSKGKQVAKSKEKEEEELKKAKKKGMKLEEYRTWRDREMWTNDYNGFRKKQILGEDFGPEEEKKMKELEKNLEKSGGIPPLSKALQELKEQRGT